MAFSYKIVTIEDYADDAPTEAALNAEGANDWDLIGATYQPNEATGKSTATLTFDKSLSSSSSSKSSSSSSSLSSSLSSSSSFSDFTFMGDGWPYPPNQIEVTIGSGWIEADVDFVEDEIITLLRADGPYKPDGAIYSEDGTTVGNDTTNRLIVTYRETQDEIQIDAMYHGSMDPALGIPYTNWPYDFAQAFDNSFIFNAATAVASPGYMFTSNTAANYNGAVFKTFTFVDN